MQRIALVQKIKVSWYSDEYIYVHVSAILPFLKYFSSIQIDDVYMWSF